MNSLGVARLSREPWSHFRSIEAVSERRQGSLRCFALLGRHTEVDVAHRAERDARINVGREIRTFHGDCLDIPCGEGLGCVAESVQQVDVAARARVIGFAEVVTFILWDGVRPSETIEAVVKQGREPLDLGARKIVRRRALSELFGARSREPVELVGSDRRHQAGWMNANGTIN